MTPAPPQPAPDGGTAHDHRGSEHGRVEQGADQWDERYAGAEQVWSGEPNGALVAEVGDLEPGRALDVGCGEGADAIWLAGRGWRVTAIDVSGVALRRAAAAADRAGVEVEWMQAALLDAPLTDRDFALVSVFYPALAHTPGRQAELALLAAVAPGGHLLVVHHADIDIEEAKAHGFDPDLYVSPDDVATGLDGGWRVTVDERRPRHVHAGTGAGHTHDVVLHAQRLS